MMARGRMRLFMVLALISAVPVARAHEACGDEVCSLKSKTSGWKDGVFVLDNKPVVRETLGCVHRPWLLLHHQLP